MNWTAIDGPVDLVGHDQGSVISQGVILARPDLIKSWVLGAGVCADDFLWHRQARIWQNTGLGERWADHFLALDVDIRAGMLVAAGLPEIDVANVAAGMDHRMFDQILPLYRSESYLEDWAFDPTATYPPGLVLWGRGRPVPVSGIRPPAAAASGARFHELACGHWWQVERPHGVAAELTAHWSDTGSAAA